VFFFRTQCSTTSDNREPVSMSLLGSSVERHTPWSRRGTHYDDSTVDERSGLKCFLPYALSPSYTAYTSPSRCPAWSISTPGSSEIHPFFSGVLRASSPVTQRNNVPVSLFLTHSSVSSRKSLIISLSKQKQQHLAVGHGNMHCMFIHQVSLCSVV